MLKPPSAPSSRLLILEQRAVLELAALAATAPWLQAVGRGDGHPVLVLPGFTASDRATTLLRVQLRRWGYWAHGWRLGRNWGPRAGVADGLAARLHELHRRHDQPVSLVGWSLGGIYARELARRFPDEVRAVVSLGSPHGAVGGPGRRAPRVPTTSIYSRTDGIVRWQLCVDRTSAAVENVEVRGSHTGLVVNPAVLYAVGDRLAQPAGAWRPFRAPAALRRFYPTPVDGPPPAS